MRYLILKLILSLSVCSSAKAQYAEEISSDRPGFTYSANTVGARVVQLQMGGDFGLIGSDDGFENSYKSGVFDGRIRVGIIERLEIGFSTTFNRDIKRITTSRTIERQSLQWGINLRGNVLNSDGKLPSIGLSAEVFFTESKTNGINTETISQQFMLLLEQPLERRINVSSNIGVLNAQKPIFQYTVNLSVDVSPKATIFIEHFGQYHVVRNSGVFNPSFLNENMVFFYPKVNGGFAIRPFSDFQIDVQSGYGSIVTSRTPREDWYIGVGVSWRARFKKREKPNPDKEKPQ